MWEDVMVALFVLLLVIFLVGFILEAGDYNGDGPLDD